MEVPRWSTALASRGKIFTALTSATRSGVPGSALYSNRAQDLTRWQAQTSPEPRAASREPRAELYRRAHTRARIIEDRCAIGGLNPVARTPLLPSALGFRSDLALRPHVGHSIVGHPQARNTRHRFGGRHRMAGAAADFSGLEH